MQARLKQELGRTRQDILRASNFPAFMYTSEEVYELELEKIFYRTWLCICRDEQLSKPGDMVVHQIGNRSIAIARGRDGRLSAFHNVCRHRGMKLLPNGQCNKSVIQCGYHGWTYSLDGQLIGTPDMGEAVGFDKKDYPLYEIKLDMWGGFVWVNLDPDCEPLSSYLGDFRREFAKYRLEDMRYVTRIGEYNVSCNWKVAIENGAECYHCHIVHPEYNKVVNYRNHRWDKYGSRMEKIKGPYYAYYANMKDEKTNRSWGGLRSSAAKTKLPAVRGLTDEDRQRCYLPHVFPNFGLVLFPDYATAYYTWPDGPYRTRKCNDLLVPKSAVSKGLLKASEINETADLINRQDIAVIEGVQEGLSTGVFTPGRYSMLEMPQRKFQQMVADALLS